MAEGWNISIIAGSACFMEGMVLDLCASRRYKGEVLPIRHNMGWFLLFRESRPCGNWQKTSRIGRKIICVHSVRGERIYLIKLYPLMLTPIRNIHLWKLVLEKYNTLQITVSFLYLSGPYCALEWLDRWLQTFQKISVPWSYESLTGEESKNFKFSS